MRRLYFHVVLLLCGFLSAATSLRAQSYTVTDLGTFGGGQTFASDINQVGDVTGYSYFPCEGWCAPHAFLYRKGELHDVGALSDGTESRGLGISGGKGEGKIRVTGVSGTKPCVQSDCGPRHAFLYSNGRMQDLGTLPSNTDSEGSAVNSSGQVTGWSGVANPEPVAHVENQHAFLYSKGEMHDLGTLPGGSISIGLDINDGHGRGRDDEVQIIGYATTASGYYHAFLYSDGTMEDLGTLPGGNLSIARAINQSGEVTGFSATSGSNQHAFLYSHGYMRDLGSLPEFPDSAGFGINDAGDVIGICFKSITNRPFLYRDGTMYDLTTKIPQDSGWVLQVVIAINNDGQITGYGDHNGEIRAFLLTPVRRQAHRKQDGHFDRFTRFP